MNPPHGVMGKFSRLFLRKKHAEPNQENYFVIVLLRIFSVIFATIFLIMMLPQYALFFCIGTLLLIFWGSWGDEKPNIRSFYPRILEEVDNDVQLAPKAHLITLSPVPDSQENAYTHAIQATQKAGVNPNWASVLPIDIGLVTFSDVETGIIYRVAPLPKTIQYLQPFVKFHVRHATHKRIRFEIRDNSDTTVLKFDKEYALKIGENFITPPVRLAIRELVSITGIWKLWIYENDEPLAVHQFGWEGDSEGGVNVPISQDGEVSAELTDELESKLGTMSLDELLSGSNSSHKKTN